MKNRTTLYLCLLVTLILWSVDSNAQALISQNLFIHKRPKNTMGSYEHMHLKDLAASQFNITRFLAKHIDDYDIRIMGNRITELETQKFEFDSKQLGARECAQFCAKKESDTVGFLGVSVKRNEDGEGVIIDEVTEGSAADRANLPVGAIITEIEELIVHSPCDFSAIIGEFYPGDKITVDYEIDETEQDVEVVLGARLSSVVTWVPCCDPTPPSVATATDENLGSLYIAPNPNDGYFQLSFELEADIPVIIRMTDNAGREVYQENLTNFNGFYNNHIDLSTVAAGLYYLNIIQKNKVISEKIVVQRL